MRRTPQLAKQFALKHDVSRFYTQARALAMDGEVDAVYVATPPGSHVALALEALAARKPCVLEAPMARNAEECWQLVDEFSAAGVPLFVNWPLRAQPRCIALSAAIAAGMIGTVTSVHYMLAKPLHAGQNGAAVGREALGWRADAAAAGGGFFMYYGGAFLDLIASALGPLSHFSGDALAAHQNSNDVHVESVVAFSCRAATPVGSAGTTGSSGSGALVSASFNFASFAALDHLVVAGTKGAITMSLFADDAPVLHQAPPAPPSLLSVPALPKNNTQIPHLQRITQVLWARQQQQHSQQAVSAAVHDAFVVSAESAVQVAEFCDAVLRGFYRSRSDQFWKRTATWQNVTASSAHAALSAYQLQHQQQHAQTQRAGTPNSKTGQQQSAEDAQKDPSDQKQ
jgi:predicted dehydrogenase